MICSDTLAYFYHHEGIVVTLGKCGGMGRAMGMLRPCDTLDRLLPVVLVSKKMTISVIID